MRRRSGPHRFARTVSVLVTVAGACAGCSYSGAAFTGPPVQHSGTRVTYLDVLDPANARSAGGVPVSSEILSRALPPYATFYEAQGEELDAITEAGDFASSVSPTVATVSVGMTALDYGEPSAQFASLLAGLLSRLRASGATTILVANLAPVNLAPGSVLPAGVVEAYNQAIATETARYGALLVDVHGTLLAAIDRRGASAVFAGTYSLTSYGWTLVADAFLAAIRDRPINASGVRAR
ncbi:MAG: GDSL-type esterase/lipase family protein [Acidimicrobiales bacterium]